MEQFIALCAYDGEHECIYVSLSFLSGIYASILKCLYSSLDHLENAYSSFKIHIKYLFSFFNKLKVGSLKITLGFLICNMEIIPALIKSQAGCELYKMTYIKETKGTED